MCSTYQNLVALSFPRTHPMSYGLWAVMLGHMYIPYTVRMISSGQRPGSVTINSLRNSTYIWTPLDIYNSVLYYFFSCNQHLLLGHQQKAKIRPIWLTLTSPVGTLILMVALVYPFVKSSKISLSVAVTFTGVDVWTWKVVMYLTKISFD